MMPFEFLSKTLATLLCLVTVQRAESMQGLQTNDMCLSEDKYIWDILKVLKNTKSGKHLAPLVFEKFLPN